MPDISQSLQGKDLQFLNSIAMTWGLELQTHDLRSAIQELASLMNQKALFLDLVDALDDASKSALKELHNAEGKIPWTFFVRKYGEIRTMGAARRERERPDLHPINAAEVLWYNGMMGKAFFNLQKEPLEYAYIPDELDQFLSTSIEPESEKKIPGRPATTLEKHHLVPATDDILDHMTTYLTAIRTGQAMETLPWMNQTIPITFLQQLAAFANLLNKDGVIQPNQVRQFMEAGRAQALLMLVNAWVGSEFNDLHQLPGLIFEGPWKNDPLETRSYLIGELRKLPPQTWWSLPAFVESIRSQTPDFQRPDGDYDSWYIRRQNSEDYLRGIRYWEDIDGALIRLILTNPMHWLGLLDLAMPEENSRVSAFRFSAWTEDLLSDQPPANLPKETENVKFLQDGTIRVPHSTSRAIRYQLARFSHLEREDPRHYEYRILPDSLSAAVKSGLKIEQFVNLIQRCGDKPIPPSVLTSLENWKTHGIQTAFSAVILLTVQDGEIIDKLMNSRAKKYLGERLNPTSILIQEKQQKLVMSILAELGYLSELQPASMVKMIRGTRR
jgi:hypothetical protein